MQTAAPCTESLWSMATIINSWYLAVLAYSGVLVLQLSLARAGTDPRTGIMGGNNIVGYMVGNTVARNMVGYTLARYMVCNS